MGDGAGSAPGRRAAGKMNGSVVATRTRIINSTASRPIISAISRYSCSSSQQPDIDSPSAPASAHQTILIRLGMGGLNLVLQLQRLGLPASASASRGCYLLHVLISPFVKVTPDPRLFPGFSIRAGVKYQVAAVIAPLTAIVPNECFCFHGANKKPITGRSVKTSSKSHTTPSVGQEHFIGAFPRRRKGHRSKTAPLW